jgi:hypothetical protein
MNTKTVKVLCQSYRGATRVCIGEVPDREAGLRLISNDQREQLEPRNRNSNYWILDPDDEPSGIEWQSIPN